MVALFEQIAPGPLARAVRNNDSLIVEVLKTVHEHRSVAFGQNVAPYLNDEIRPEPYEVLVEGSMMELAQGKAVGHDGGTQRIDIRHDVGGVE